MSIVTNATHQHTTIIRSLDIVPGYSYTVGQFRVMFVTKKWKILLLNSYSLIDDSASCWSQDIQVFEN